MDLIPDFGSFLFTIVAFVAALSIIVAIHEYGHYIVGKWSGIKADVFSIGMGPVLASRVDKHGTRWQIAAFPVGGYVKFRGDSNPASVNTNLPGVEAGRDTMVGAPLWARAATVAAGPAFNFALSILVFAVVLAVRGVATDPLVIEEVRELPGVEAQVAPGDRLLQIGGEPVPEVSELSSFVNSLPVEPRLNYVVERGGEEVSFDGPYPYPTRVAGVNPQSAASDAGLEEGDVITAIEGREVFAFSQLREVVGASDGAPLALEVWRPDGQGGAETLEVTLEPRRMDLPMPEGGFETRWLIGITGGLYLTPETQPPGVFEALSYGAEQTLFIIRSSLSGLYHMIAGAISTCNLQGPVGIAQTSGAAASAGALSFVWFVAVLSTAVGLLNLFPIPVLDGGHLMFHAYEAVRGKPPSDKAMNVLMGAGLALLATLMIFALTNDFLCP